MITVGIIARNEERYLPILLGDLTMQTYPKNLTEIVMVNAGSEDGTLAIMTDFLKGNYSDYASIKIVCTKPLCQSASWNTVIKVMRGDILIRLDGHSGIARNFIEKNAEALSDEFASGGIRRNIIDGNSAYKRTLLAAENAFFGSGAAEYRRGTAKQYVKTVAHAAYKKEVFEVSGGFNEKIKRAEDNEFHARIIRNGFPIRFSEQIESVYQTRSGFYQMLKQKFGNGMWVAITSKLSADIFSFYHFIPFLFLCGLVVSAAALIMYFVTGFAVLYIIPLTFICAYGAAAVIAAVFEAFDKRLLIAAILLPFMFFMLHTAYGAGSLIGFLRAPFINLKEDNGVDLQGR